MFNNTILLPRVGMEMDLWNVNDRRFKSLENKISKKRVKEQREKMKCAHLMCREKTRQRGEERQHAIKGSLWFRKSLPKTLAYN